MSNKSEPIHLLSVSRASICITPPKPRLKHSIPVMARGQCKVQERKFEPLRRAAETTFHVVIPKGKQPRLNQTTPKKTASHNPKISKKSLPLGARVMFQKCGRRQKMCNKCRVHHEECSKNGCATESGDSCAIKGEGCARYLNPHP